jgi:hypothetical protein
MTGFYPYNHALGQEIQSDVTGLVQDRGFIAHLTFADPAAAAEDGVVAGGPVATSDSEVTTVTTGITNPDYPRNVVINPDGTTADVAAGNITVVGTNIADEAISEDIAVVENQAHDTLSAGALAFKTITSISIPIQDGAGATFHIGTGDKLGMPYMLAANTVLVAALNGVREGTAPTVDGDDDEVEKNTVDLNSALDGNQVDVWLIV